MQVGVPEQRNSRAKALPRSPSIQGDAMSYALKNCYPPKVGRSFFAVLLLLGRQSQSQA